jgi:hypothetical protein
MPASFNKDDPAHWRARAEEAHAREKAMGERDDLGKADQKVTELKKRIARQLQVVERAKERGQPTAAAKSILQSLERSLSHFREAPSGDFRKAGSEAEMTAQAMSTIRAPKPLSLRAGVLFLHSQGLRRPTGRTGSETRRGTGSRLGSALLEPTSAFRRA